MKKVIVVFLMMLSTQTFAAVKCEADGRGGMCCWDTNKDGPWKPISC